MAEDVKQLGRLTEYGKITGNTVTAIFTATGVTPIRYLNVTENAGSTPNLTVEVYDGTTSYYPGATNLTAWKAKAVTAYQSVVFDQQLNLQPGWSIRLTSSDAAGKFDWFLTYDNPYAAGRSR